jgi:hypothetical protein
MTLDCLLGLPGSRLVGVALPVFLLQRRLHREVAISR